MKVIDLLNKIANDEEPPKKIKWLDQIFEYDDNDKFYYQNGFSMYRDFYTEGNCLNDEIEIIEESNEVKVIKKISTSFKSNCLNNDLQRQIVTIQHNCALACAKIDELVDALNELRKEK